MKGRIAIGGIVACALAALAASGPAGARVAAASFALAPPTAAEVGPSGGGDSSARQPIGYPRAIPALQTAADMGRALQWASLPDGGALAAVSVTSPGAAALRVGIRVGELAPSAVLRFYGPGDAAPQEVAAATILAVLERNRNAGESGPEARTYWSPIVDGDAVVIEIEVRSDADRASLAITAPVVSHLTQAPETLASGANAGVALFTIAGETDACAATLVAPLAGVRAAGLLPGNAPAAVYLVTAGRCAPSQAAASTLEAFWPPASDAANTSGVGAALLYASSGTDTAFLALDRPPRNATSLAHAPSQGMDPALEQWLGRVAETRAGQTSGSFSLP